MHGAAAGLHVQKVVVETFVAGGVGFGTLRAGFKKPQELQRSLNGVGARENAALDGDDVDAEAHADGRDARGRAGPGAVGDQSGLEVRFFQEIIDDGAAEIFEHGRVVIAQRIGAGGFHFRSRKCEAGRHGAG